MTPSQRCAQRFRVEFSAAKRVALRAVRSERSTRAKAMKSLRRSFEEMCSLFLRTPGTTYVDWTEIVRPEWDEVLAAAEDDSAWDYLLEAVERRAA